MGIPGEMCFPPPLFLSLISVFLSLLVCVYIKIFSMILLKFNHTSPKTYPPLERLARVREILTQRELAIRSYGKVKKKSQISVPINYYDYFVQFT